MPYDTLKEAQIKALLCLDPGQEYSCRDVAQAIQKSYGERCNTVAFHLKHLSFIGLVELVSLKGGAVGCQLTELGIRAGNQIARNLNCRRFH